MIKNLEQLGLKIKHSKTVNWLYDLEFYLTQGRGKVQEYLAFFSYLTILAGGVKYLLGIDLSRKIIIITAPIITVCLILFGWLMVKLNLYHVDVMRNMHYNPVQKEIYNAARRINERGNLR